MDYNLIYLDLTSL